jgi:hypothetical protein
MLRVLYNYWDTCWVGLITCVVYCDTKFWGGQVTCVVQLLVYVLGWTCYVCGITIGIRDGVDMLRVLYSYCDTTCCGGNITCVV